MLKPANLIGSLLVLLVISVSLAFGQTGTSGISGTVRDSNGAVVANATVTAKNEATNVSQNQNTTDAGLFAFPSLPVGVYTITAEKTGFKTLQRTGNILEVGTPLTVDLTLEVGQVSETVNVQASTEQIQTANATIGNVVEQKAIEALPLNGRNPLALILYEPGVVQRSQGAAGSGVHVNGSRDRAFNVTIDGIDANESSVPNPVSNLYRLNPDNVQEYKVTTNNATAEEGRNSGASVSIATRPGTNEFHGNGFYFLRNEALNANEFFADALGSPKPIIRLHQYGVEMGGPIKKNKTFFFGGIQLVKINYTQAIDQAFGAVPLVYTPTALSGIFRFVKGTVNGFTKNSPALVDHNTGALLPGVPVCATPTSTNCVASYNIFARDNLARGLDPVGGAILKSYPAANSFGFGDGLNTAGFFWNPPSQFKGPSIMGRVDHTFNQNNSIFGRYLWSKYDTTKGDFLNNRPVVFPGFPPLGEVLRTTGNLALSWRRVISPRVVNEFTMGYSRFKFLFTFGESNPAFPNIPPFDFINTDEPYLNIPHTFRAVTTPQALDNVSVTHGAHVFRFGGAVRFYRHRDQRGLPGGSNLAPTVSFDPTIRAPITCPSPPIPAGLGCFNGLTASALGISNSGSTAVTNDFLRLQGAINDLIGLPARIQQNFLGNLNGDFFLPFQVGNQVTLHAVGTHLDQYNFYGQDEWKIRPNVTLNYGLRWEINPAPFTVGGNTFQPATTIAGTPGPANPIPGAPGPVTFVATKRWYNRNNIGAIAPALGLAWTPDYKSGFLHTIFGGNGKSVIRLGYRMAFDTVSSFQATAVAGKVPGVVTLCSSVPSSTPTSNCTGEPADPNNTLRISSSGFLASLPPPSAKPSSFLTPTLQLRTNAPAAIVFDPNLKIPTVHEWSLSVQRELPHGFVFQAAYIGRRGTRLFRAYDINEIEAAPIVNSFLTMQQNAALGCKADGTGCPAGVTGTTPALFSQLVNAFIAERSPTPTLAQATALASSFLNSSTVAGQLSTNAAGAFAGRIEQTVLGLKLRPNQQFSTITYLDSGGDSYYHAAQFTLRRRFTSGLGLTMAYTFGRSIDDQSLDPVGAASGGGLSTTNSRTPITISNWRLERSRSDFDRTHVFTATSVWDVPVGRGKRFLTSSRGVVNQLLGGWSVNGIFTAMSGEPFSVRSGALTANNSHQSRAVLLTPGLQPQLQNIPNVIGPVLFKDAGGFALPAPGSNGDGRNIFTAPPYWNLDLGFIKMFQLTERFKLQFRMEMFNALNHPNFDNPRDASVGSPAINSPVFAQTCCVTVAPVGAQSVLPLGESPRVIQFALKLQF